MGGGILAALTKGPKSFSIRASAAGMHRLMRVDEANPMNSLRLTVQAAFLGLALTAINVGAQVYTSVALPSDKLNANIQTWTNGTGYSGLFPSTQTWSGVPITLTSNASGNNVFGAGAGVLDLSVSLFGADSVYTIINSAWGEKGNTVGSVRFIGTGGLVHTVNLVEGFNVRDHYNNTSAYTDELTDPNSMNVFTSSTGVRLDMQKFDLPDEFLTQTLTSIQFTSAGGSPQGQPFLAAATVMAIPEPETYALLLSGLALVGVVIRRCWRC